MFLPTFDGITDIKMVLWDFVFTHWLSVELFSYSWFAIVGSMLVSYIIFISLIDKSRLRELLLYGSLLAVVFGHIDVIGTNTGLWEYKTHLMPFTPSLFPFSYTIHPIAHILEYQYTNSWRSFAIYNTLATILFAFVAQPFFIWLQVLWFGKWTSFYSFILGLAVTFFVRAVVIWLANIELKHTTESSRTFLMPKLQPAMKLFHKDDKKK